MSEQMFLDMLIRYNLIQGLAAGVIERHNSIWNIVTKAYWISLLQSSYLPLPEELRHGENCVW